MDDVGAFLDWLFCPRAGPGRGQAHLGVSPAAQVYRLLVNGSAGAVIIKHGRPALLMAFAICHGKIIEIDSIGDPERVEQLAAAVLTEPGSRCSAR